MWDPDEVLSDKAMDMAAELQQASPVTDVEKKTIMPLHAPTLMKKHTESSQVYNNPLLPMKQNISPLED